MKVLSKLLVFFALSVLPIVARAQKCDPHAYYITITGDTIDNASLAQDAPLQGFFRANPIDADGYSARYEWKVCDADDPTNVLVHRFEEDFEYTFEQSGSFLVQLNATFSKDGLEYQWPEEGTKEDPFSVVISSSKLEMPNAFSPNGDPYNDVYNAKSYQSIVSFKATIFNRWGQRIYSWTDPDVKHDGWNGKFNGRRVKDGVYFVVVNARGADGRVFNIRKDVNVLTGYDNNASAGGGSDE